MEDIMAVRSCHSGLDPESRIVRVGDCAETNVKLYEKAIARRELENNKGHEFEEPKSPCNMHT
jgi:hypothetical protein